MNTETMSVDLGLNEGLDVGCRGCGPAPAGDGCGCGGGCSGGAVERPRWFVGQLVGPADLDALQQWVITKARRHNRLLHGWGVVCGLAVLPVVSPDTDAPEPWTVMLSPGSALSAAGDDISVAGRVLIDIRQPTPSGSDACTPPVDPWCAPVRQRRDPERTYYLAIRYAEELRRPVRGSSSGGCGCDDDPCNYSRVAETFALAVLDELPECYQEVETGHGNGKSGVSGFACTSEIEESGTRGCPACCSPWVVLADLRVDTAGVVQIDPRSHRRFVASVADMAFTCPPPAGPPAVGFTAVEKDVVARLFTEKQANLADVTDRAALLMAPASELRGARGSTALRTLIGDRTVAEVASIDVSILRTALIQAGGEPDTVERVHELAALAVRLGSTK